MIATGSADRGDRIKYEDDLGLTHTFTVQASTMQTVVVGHPDASTVELTYDWLNDHDAWLEPEGN